MQSKLWGYAPGELTNAKGKIHEIKKQYIEKYGEAKASSLKRPTNWMKCGNSANEKVRVHFTCFRALSEKPVIITMSVCVQSPT